MSKDGNFPLVSESGRIEVGKALKQLCVAFDAVEKAVRREIVSHVAKADRVGTSLFLGRFLCANDSVS